MALNFDAILGKMEAQQTKSLENTQRMKESENDFDMKMQATKLKANAAKSFNDALKATANNVAQMGRAQ